MKADPTDTRAVLCEVVEHAGEGALPERLIEAAAHSGFGLAAYEGAQRRVVELSPDEVRDLCDGHWDRSLARMPDKSYGTWVGDDGVCHVQLEFGHRVDRREGISWWAHCLCREGPDPFAARAELILALAALDADLARRVFAGARSNHD